MMPLFLLPAVPVLILLAAAAAVAVGRDDGRDVRWLAAIGFAGAAATLALLGRQPAPSLVLGADGFTTTMGIAVVAMGATVAAAPRHGTSRRWSVVIVLSLAAAGLVAIGSTSLLVMASALAVVWSGAALAAGSVADERGSAPVVRFVVGAGAAGMLAVFGAGLIVAATGTDVLEDVRVRVATGSLDPNVILLVGAVLIGMGMFFAIVLLPLQTAAADEVDVDGGVAVLVAAAVTLAVLVRLLLTTLDPLRDVWVPVVSALAGVLMIGGALGALVHVRLHRALTWLSVFGSGLVLAAMIPAVREGTEAAVLLLLTWVAALACVVVAFGLSGNRVALRPLHGLGWSQPAAGLALSAGALTLAGAPATVGFVSRWHLVTAVLLGDRWDMALAHGLATALALVVSVRIVGRVWAWPAEQSRRARHPAGPHTAAMLLVAAPLVVFGIWTSPVAALVRRAAAALF
jgi:NADH:ubiquinone oxidoreductase subunit 2 (subunit N)